MLTSAIICFHSVSDSVRCQIMKLNTSIDRGGRSTNESLYVYALQIMRHNKKLGCASAKVIMTRGIERLPFGSCIRSTEMKMQ
jgi:hypothetical protein